MKKFFRPFYFFIFSIMKYGTIGTGKKGKFVFVEMLDIIEKRVHTEAGFP